MTKEYRIKGQDDRPLKLKKGDWYKISFLTDNGLHEFLGLFNGDIKYQEPHDSFMLTNLIYLNEMDFEVNCLHTLDKPLGYTWCGSYSNIEPIDAAKAILILDKYSHPGLDNFIQSAGHKLYEYNPEPDFNWIQKFVSEIFGIGEKIGRMRLEQRQVIEAAKRIAPQSHTINSKSF